jgi:lipopolysaccharide/colanic/teichoic acid biosynthesis glycosyltransferase
MRHRFSALAMDLAVVGLSPFLALLLRDNFVLVWPHFVAIAPYAVISFTFSVVVFAVAWPQKTLWRSTSLPDVLHILGAMTVALLLALFASFTASRLEGVARSVPLIQWLLLVCALAGARVAVRVWHDHARRHPSITTEPGLQRVLVVGVNHVTELYLRTLAAYGSNTIEVVGLLSERRELRGRMMWRYEVMGAPEELARVIAQLEVHGVSVERIAVMLPFKRLSRSAAEALLRVEQGSSVKVDWIVERLGLGEAPSGEEQPAGEAGLSAHQVRPNQFAAVGAQYVCIGHVKRAFDIVTAFLLASILAPIVLLTSLLVALDVGLPLIFWQQRPGRFGRPFRLFKFCTMRHAHDQDGNRVPDALRSSKIGRLLRRTRLDELPQLYNIVIGEMSFVGPRPLLPVDQPDETGPRLLVRPGLTGLAQVLGGRIISAEHKNALDIWYIRNASLWLDIKILLQTLILLMRGERVDHQKMHPAWFGLERPISQSAQNLDSQLFTSKDGVNGQVKVVLTTS